MNDPQPSQGLSVFAALTPLAAVPLGLVLLAFTAGRDLRDAFLEAGVMMYGALLVALVASLGAAGAVYMSSRSSVRAAGAVPALGVLIVAVGAFGYRSGLSSSVGAVAHASPMDRGRILCAAVAEVSWLVVFPLLLMGALLLSSGAGLLLAALARGADPQATSRRGLVVLGVGSLGLGAWLLTASRVEHLAGEAFRALAHTSPMDKLTIFLGTLEERAAMRPLEVGCAGAVVLVALLGAVWLRTNRAAATGVAAYLLLGLVGAQGFRSLARVTHDAQANIAEGLKVEPLLELDGAETEDFSGLVLDGDGLRRDGQQLGSEPDRLVARVREGVLVVGLEQRASPELFGALVSEALEQRIDTLDLVGVHTTAVPPGLTVPEWLGGAMTTYRAVRVKLVHAEDCEAPCERSKVTQQAVTTPDGVWPLVEKSSGYLGRDPVFVDWQGLDPRLLLRAASTVAGRGKQLVLVWPSTTAPTDASKEAPSADAASAFSSLLGDPRQPVGGGILGKQTAPLKQAPGKAHGTLAPELIRQVADRNLGQVKHCYETALRDNPALTGTVSLAFTIGPTGAVTHAKAVSTAHDAQLEACLVRRLMTWVFPKPSGGAVDVTYPFSFK